MYQGGSCDDKNSLNRQKSLVFQGFLLFCCRNIFAILEESDKIRRQGPIGDLAYREKER
jgi:hypothetical protein